MTTTPVAKDLLKTEGILTCHPHATLSQALTKLSSSHDAVFVATDTKLLGVISPYYVIFRSHYPPATKVLHCLFSPPRLRPETPVWEIANQMLLSKVYYLPVLSQKEEWLGIVSVRSLMRAIVENKELRSLIKIKPSTRPVVTINENATLGEARTLLRQSGVARLPVVDSGGRLVGLLTRYDLRGALGTRADSLPFKARVGEKRKISHQPINAYYKKAVETASPDTPLWQMVSTMLEKNIGSVVIVNPKWQPVRILTYKDLLEAIAKLNLRAGGELVIRFSQETKDREACENLLDQLFTKLKKRANIRRLEVNVQVGRNPAEKVNRYTIKAIAESPKGKSAVAQADAYDWKTATREAMDRLEVQLTKQAW